MEVRRAGLAGRACLKLSRLDGGRLEAQEDFCLEGCDPHLNSWLLSLHLFFSLGMA